jgi:3-oxoacyl-(acyl-carrier-protein) synthase
MGPKSVSPFFVPGSIINLAPGYLSIKYGLKGPNLTVVTACASGTHSIATAARHIAYGDADMMLSGGTEMATSALGMAGFCALKALSKNNDNPTQASRPFDRDRDGFVLGDGAAIFILEEYEHAKKRGANIYAEISGCGFTSDAFHMTGPDPSATGTSQCMQQAILDAGIQAEQIDYLNAHATSTKAGDAAEVAAIKKVFGVHAKQLAISATKSMHGHLLGASGALEAGFCALAIRDQIAPPTINLAHPDVGFDLDFIPHHAREMKIDACLSNSFGFGGTNGCLIIQKI